MPGQQQIFDSIKAHLSAQGRTMRQGTIVDATLIAAFSSTKNKEGKCDPEMRQTKNGNQWYFGMKAYADMDKDSGLINSVVVTTANVHDLIPTADLLHGDEEVVYTDAGYQGISKRAEMGSTAAVCRVAMSPERHRALPDIPEGRLQDQIETAKAHITSKGEHPFRVIKQQFGFQKTRLRDLAKNRCKINALAALSNPLKAR